MDSSAGPLMFLIPDQIIIASSPPAAARRPSIPLGFPAELYPRPSRQPLLARRPPDVNNRVNDEKSAQADSVSVSTATASFGLTYPQFSQDEWGSLAVSTLRTTDVMNGRQRHVRSTLALARLTVFLNRKHGVLQRSRLKPRCQQKATAGSTRRSVREKKGRNAGGDCQETDGNPLPRIAV